MASDQQVKYVSLNNQDEDDREEATAPRQGTTATPSQYQSPMVAQPDVMHQPMMTTPLYPSPLAREYLPQGRATQFMPQPVQLQPQVCMTHSGRLKLKAKNVTL